MTKVVCLSVLSILVAIAMLPSCSNKVTSFRSYGKRAGSGPGGDQSQTPGGGNLPGGAPTNLVDKNLMWKRYRSLEQTLMSGLALNKGQLCKEAGKLNCVDEVHLFALGGNEPFNKAQYNRLEAPSVTTGVAIERLVLASCSERVRRDKGASPRVFTKMKLTNEAPVAAEVQAQATVLYQRLLLRNPTPDELAIVQGFASRGGSSETVAKSLCFAIASHAEFLFI